MSRTDSCLQLSSSLMSSLVFNLFLGGKGTNVISPEINETNFLEYSFPLSQNSEIVTRSQPGHTESVKVGQVSEVGQLADEVVRQVQVDQCLQLGQTLYGNGELK